MTSYNEFLAYAFGVIEKGTAIFGSAEQLALEFINDQSFSSDAARISSMIKWESSRNFLGGCVCGAIPSGPAGVGIAMVNRFLVQGRLAAAIARIHGHSIDSERVRTLVLASFLGQNGVDFLKRELIEKFGYSVITTTSTQIFLRAPDFIFAQIRNSLVTQIPRLVGIKTVANTIKRSIPLVGALISGSLDASSCLAVGKMADRLFSSS